MGRMLACMPSYRLYIAPRRRLRRCMSWLLVGLTAAALWGSAPAFSQRRPVAGSAVASSTWSIRADGTRLEVEVHGATDPERLKLLRRWLQEAAHAARLPSGRFPLSRARVIVREIDSRSRSPVPWGQTRRNGEVSVLLFVRRGASLDELRAD